MLHAQKTPEFAPPSTSFDAEDGGPSSGEPTSAPLTGSEEGTSASGEH